jgi:hypothetical protein
MCRRRARAEQSSYLGERSTTTRVVDDVRNHTLDIAVTFGKVLRSDEKKIKQHAVSLGSREHSLQIHSIPTPSTASTVPDQRARASNISIINQTRVSVPFHRLHRFAPTENLDPSSRAIPSLGPTPRIALESRFSRARTCWRCFAAPLRVCVWEVKTDPLPLRQPRMTRPMANSVASERDGGVDSAPKVDDDPTRTRRCPVFEFVTFTCIPLINV